MRKLFAKRTFAFLLALCAFSLSAAAQVSTTTLASGTNPSILGASVTFTAVVTPNTATGTVSFYDGGTLIGSAVVNAGTAAFSTSLLSPATHSVNATYNGDGSLNPSTSSTVNQTVNVRPTTLVMGALAPVLYGSSRNVSITVTDAGPAAQTCPAPPPTQNTLVNGRSGHTATLLLSGQVLVIGGGDVDGTPIAAAELYDPATCSFTNLAGALNTARTGHTATRLSDGRVLIIGGTSTGAPAGAVADAEIFDPLTGAFTQLGGANQHLLVARSEHTATLLANGNVLIAGGVNAAGTTIASAEVVNAATLNFTAGPAPMGIARSGHTASLLTVGPHAGEVLFAGGDATGTAETYNSSSGASLQTAQPMNTARTQHAAVVTPDGKVVFFGGLSGATVLTSAEEYDPLTGLFTALAGVTLTTPRDNHTATLLANGRVLIAGGNSNATNGLTSAALYDHKYDPSGDVVIASNNATDTPHNCTLASDGSGVSTCLGSVTAGAVGARTITATYGGDTNHSGSTDNQPLTVNPAPLTVKANDINKPYHTAYTFTGTEFSTIGLVAGDTVTSATITSTGASVGAKATAPGPTYPILISAAVGTGLGNYTITYTPGTLTVTPAPLTITANSTSKPYHTAITFAGTEFTTSGLLTGDTVTSATITSAGAPATATVVAPGPTYPINISAAVGTGLDNYNITYVAGTLTVTPIPATITAGDATKQYGLSYSLGNTNFTSSGFIAPDAATTVTLTSPGALPEATFVAPGPTYPITPSAAVGTGVGNYTITYLPGTLTLTQAPLTITAGSGTKKYRVPIVFAGTEFTTSTLYNADAVTHVTLVSAGADPAASVAAPGPNYAVTPSNAVGTGIGNYLVSYANGAITVQPDDTTTTFSMKVNAGSKLVITAKTCPVSSTCSALGTLPPLPGGAATIKDGTVALATALTLTNGVGDSASIPLNSLANGPHVLSVAMPASANYNGSSSGTHPLQVANVIASAPGTSVAAIQVNTVAGGSGSFTTPLTCSVYSLDTTIPVPPLTCSATASGTNLPTTLTITIDNTHTASILVPGKSGRSYFAFLSTTGLGIPAFVLVGTLWGSGRRRSTTRARATVILGFVLLLVLTALSVGCSGSFSAAPGSSITPPVSNFAGTYSLVVSTSDSDGAQVLATVPFKITF